MNKKNYLIATVAVFAFIFFFEWIFHSLGLGGIYRETASVWRPEAEMQGQYMKWMLAGQVLFAVIFTLIFTFGYKGKGVLEGFRYGLYVGLLFCASNFVWYAVLPIPMKLLWGWNVGTVVELVLSGIIASLIYKPIST